jgi:hypothetical protein
MRLVAATLIATSSCSFTKGKETAEAAVAQFHTQYNAGQYREIYSQADEDFKKASTEADFLMLLEALHRKLGTVKESNEAAWNVNATTMGTLVTLGYSVEFREGKGTEQFVFRINDDKAKLLNYNVNSPLLITR